MNPIGAIDIGTNSTRLLVGQPTGAGTFDVLDERLVITRLGKGVDATRQLAADSIERTATALADYAAIMQSHGVTQFRMTTTSAARDATNGGEFFAAARAATGQEPEILSGHAEGQLSFAGATQGFDPAAGPFLVVDIGGGSTEFAWGTTTCDESVSLDIGAVRITERYLESDPPKPEELHAAVSVVNLFLDDLDRDDPAWRAARTLVGVAGTITTMAAVEIGLMNYDRDALHHYHLTHAAAEDVFRTLATESLADRRHNPGLDPARADVIVGGCVILCAIMRRLNANTCVVSQRDLLHALASSLCLGSSTSPLAS